MLMSSGRSSWAGMVIWAARAATPPFSALPHVASALPVPSWLSSLPMSSSQRFSVCAASCLRKASCVRGSGFLMMLSLRKSSVGPCARSRISGPFSWESCFRMPLGRTSQPEGRLMVTFPALWERKLSAWAWMPMPRERLPPRAAYNRIACFPPSVEIGAAFFFQGVYPPAEG